MILSYVILILLFIRISFYCFTFVVAQEKTQTLMENEQVRDFNMKVIKIQKSQYGGYSLTFKLQGLKSLSDIYFFNKRGSCYISEDNYNHLLSGLQKKDLLYQQMQITGNFESPLLPSNPGQGNILVRSLSQKFLGSFQLTQIKLNKSKFVYLDTIARSYYHGNQWVKRSVDNQINLLYHENEAGVLSAMILGDKVNLNNDVKEIYKENGISHIIAISGLHVGMLYMMLDALLKLLLVNRSKRFHICLVFMLVYNGLLGLNISAIRATLMIFIMHYAIAKDYPYDKGKGLFLTACVFLIFYPESIFNCGFLLSYGAVVGLFYIYPLLKSKLEIRRMHFLVISIFDLLLVSISVMVITFPILLFYFNGISFSSLIANVLIVPMVFFFYIGGIVSVIISYLVIPLSMFLAGSVTMIHSYMLFVCQCLSKLFHGIVYMRRFDVMDYFLYYSVTLVFFYYVTIEKKLKPYSEVNTID